MVVPQIQCGDDYPVQDKSSAPLIVSASDYIDKSPCDDDQQRT